jgi:hypothetical protein
MLLHNGFVPIKIGYHQVLPSLISFSLNAPDKRELENIISLFNKIYKLNNYVEKLLPINKFATNIFAIAQKKDSI